MKNLLKTVVFSVLIFCATLSAFNIYAQSSWANPLSTNYLVTSPAATTLVGIGVNTPTDPLTINNTMSLYDANDHFRNILGRSNQGGINIWTGTGVWNNSGGGVTNWDGSGIFLHAKNEPGLPGAVEFVSYSTNNTQAWNDGVAFAFRTYDFSQGDWYPKMLIKNDGRVLIGSDIGNTNNAPSGYNLYVSKGILTEKVKVAVSTTTNWSDYVFNKNYKLMSLKNVEQYVNSKRHLPEIPSASEVVKDGVDVANMDAKLLQKIEELTLYAIRQQKQIELMNQEIKKLKKRN